MPSVDIIEFGVEDIVRSGLCKEYLMAKNELGNKLSMNFTHHNFLGDVELTKKETNGIRFTCFTTFLMVSGCLLSHR